MRKAFLLALTALVFVGLMPTAARADSMNFTGGPGDNGGVLGWDGGSTPLSVIDSVIDSVFLTSLGPAFAHDVDGSLSFTTGSVTSCTGCPPPEAGGLLSVIFGGGGSFDITGSVEDFGIAAGTTLVSGIFLPGSTATFTLLPLGESGEGVGLDGATFSGTLGLTFINPDLLAAMGFPPTWTTGDGSVFTTFVDMLWSADGEGNFEVDATVDEAKVEVTPVPEPSTLLLLGSAMLLGVRILRRKVVAVA